MCTGHDTNSIRFHINFGSIVWYELSISTEENDRRNRRWKKMVQINNEQTADVKRPLNERKK